MNFSNNNDPKLTHFDVGSFFTKNPIYLAIKLVDSHFISLNCAFPKDTLIRLLNFVFDLFFSITLFSNKYMGETNQS